MTGRFRSAQPNEGERDDRLDARVPIHRLQGGDECVALELGVARIIVVAELGRPARRLGTAAPRSGSLPGRDIDRARPDA
jgi:hypothetical protein